MHCTAIFRRDAPGVYRAVTTVPESSQAVVTLISGVPNGRVPGRGFSTNQILPRPGTRPIESGDDT